MSKVYFLHAPAVNLVKIGTSFDPERRLQEVRLISPVEVRLIGVIRGDYKTEGDLHKRFEGLRARGEWFHATEALLSYAWRAALAELWNEATPSVRAWFREYINRPVEDTEVA